MPNREKIDIIRRIQDAGYLREFDNAPHINLPKLKIENNPYESFAFVFCGGMGVILDLRITSDRAVQFQDFGDLELLGRPCNVDWWASEKSDVYKFYLGPEFPRDVVLNMCSKSRSQSRGSLYAPCSGNKPDLVDGVEDLAPKRREQADTDGSEVDSAEPQPGGTATARA
jgi:hypothetical protein